MRTAALLAVAVAMLGLTACEKKSGEDAGDKPTQPATETTASTDDTTATPTPTDDDDAPPDDEPAPSTAPADPRAHAEALWQQLEAEGYATWPLFPGTAERYPGTRPHGAILTTRVNEVARAALEAGTSPMPDGAILVKLNHDMDGQLQATTVMAKQAGVAPDQGDWFWLKRLADGTLEEAGAVEGCIGCHQVGTDYVRTVVDR